VVGQVAFVQGNQSGFGSTLRDANNIAHQLAKRALERHEWMVMRNDIPADLRSLVTAETAGEAGFPNRCNPNLNH
jgi:hypothetical protein